MENRNTARLRRQGSTSVMGVTLASGRGRPLVSWPIENTEIRRPDL